MKLNKLKSILLTIIIFLSFLSIAWGPEFYLNPTDIGDLSDSRVYSVSIGDNFSSGDTISSSEMNNKFEKLKELVELLINNNISNNNLSDLPYISSEGEVKTILFITEGGGRGSFGGRTGADNSCRTDYAKTRIEQYGSKTCNSVKAIISTSDLSINNLYNGNVGPLYNPKGGLIANTWNEFLNLSQIDITDFGGFSGSTTSIWFGDNTDNCNNWTSESPTMYGKTSNFYNNSNIFDGDTISCSQWKNLLCSCE